MRQPQQVVSAPRASSYGFHCVLQGLSFAEAIAAVTAALKTEGINLYGSKT